MHHFRQGKVRTTLRMRGVQHVIDCQRATNTYPLRFSGSYRAASLIGWTSECIIGGWTTRLVTTIRIGILLPWLARINETFRFGILSHQRCSTVVMSPLNRHGCVHRTDCAFLTPTNFSLLPASKPLSSTSHTRSSRVIN